ncbi:MAG: hypothetical protein QF903_12425 [Planctomycetota bacterium]|nr:hypothetical protein [Planctomycetota bacterium]
MIALSFVCSAAGDVLVLRDGRRIEGRITLESAALVRIRTSLAELEFPRSQVESIERTKSKAEEFRERWAAAREAGEFHELGLWCEERRMRKEARKCMRRAVELDPRHAPAQRWLGKVEYEGEWVTPEERDRRMAAAREAEMRERGLVRFEDRWVTPQERRHLERGEVLVEGRWVPFAQAQRARGLEEYEGEWLASEVALARRAAARVAEASGAPFASVENAQALLAGPVPPALLEHTARGLLAGRTWFDGALGAEPGLGIFGGRLAEFYLFSESSEPFVASVPHFATLTDRLPGNWAESAARVHGFWLPHPHPMSSARRWHRDENGLIGHCYHHWGHLLLNRLAYDGRLLPPWYDEGFASLMEFRIHGRNAVFCRSFLVVTSGTSAGASTAFHYDPKDIREGRWRELVVEALDTGHALGFDRIAAKQFSELSLVDVAVSMAILEWLESLGPEAFGAFHARLLGAAPKAPARVIERASERHARYDAAFAAAAGEGFDHRRADRAWRAWFRAR